MKIEIHTTYESMNKMFWEVYDRYGFDQQPYEYSTNPSSTRTDVINLPCWRYDKKFLIALFNKYSLELPNFTENDHIFIYSDRAKQTLSEVTV